MPDETLFDAANTAALVAWVTIIFLPRTLMLRRLVQVLVIGGLCVAYTVLIQVHFFGVSGGGFGSLAAVQRLFSSTQVALAGWLHYLAFDLFVGLWIAWRGDALGMSRWLQAPLLAATFTFGPIGLLLFAMTAATRVSLFRAARRPATAEKPASPAEVSP
jgi:hypothetical protein